MRCSKTRFQRLGNNSNIPPGMQRQSIATTPAVWTCGRRSPMCWHDEMCFQYCNPAAINVVVQCSHQYTDMSRHVRRVMTYRRGEVPFLE
jgi:hypothetical protein